MRKGKVEISCGNNQGIIIEIYRMKNTSGFKEERETGKNLEEKIKTDRLEIQCLRRKYKKY